MRARLFCSLGCLTLIAAELPAQRPAANAARVRLSSVIAGFLADSGVRTRGLAWTTGNELGIKWESAAPQPNRDPYSLRQGLTLVRRGTFTGTGGDSIALPMLITVSGTQTGLARVAIFMQSMAMTRADGSGHFVTREMIERALKADGLTLQPLKCSREKEGASYGNLVDAVRAPGKTASGLWWMWDSPRQEMTLLLTILYRRADMTEAECQG